MCDIEILSGLTQVTINGEGVLNATLQRVEELLDELPAQLEVGQPVLQEPLYIREARFGGGEEREVWVSSWQRLAGVGKWDTLELQFIQSK